MAYPNPKTAKSQPHEARYDNSTAARTHSYFFKLESPRVCLATRNSELKRACFKHS